MSCFYQLIRLLKPCNYRYDPAISMNIRLFIALCLVTLLAPLDPHAQDQSDGTLHVLRPSINAEQEKAEFCLELDHALDLSDRNRILGAIHLQSESKTVQIAPANVSIS